MYRPFWPFFLLIPPPPPTYFSKYLDIHNVQYLSVMCVCVQGGKIPVRWTAPEAIAFRKFTSASDVWSYGVVLWEVMSYGERPYWNWSNQDVIKSIEKGYRLPAPMDCPEALYQLMLDCWQKQRTHRPTFASIVTTLDNLARQPQTLLTTRNSPDNDSTQMIEVSSRGHNVFISTDMWLESIKMSRYSQHLKEANLVTAQQVSSIKGRDSLGVFFFWFLVFDFVCRVLPVTKSRSF